MADTPISLYNDTLDVLSLIQTVNKGYGLPISQVLAVLPASGQWRYETVVDKLLADKKVLSSGDLYTGHKRVLRALSAPTSSLLLTILKHFDYDKMLAVIDIFASHYCPRVTSKSHRNPAINGKGENDSSNSKRKGDWISLGSMLDELHALKNAGLVVFDPVYMTVTLTSYGKSQLLKPWKVRLLGEVDSDPYFLIERLLHSLITVEGNITVGKVKHHIFATLEKEQPKPAKQMHSQLLKIITKVIRLAIDQGRLLASNYHLTDDTVLSASYDAAVIAMDIHILGSIQQQLNATTTTTTATSTSTISAAQQQQSATTVAQQQQQQKQSGITYSSIVIDHVRAWSLPFELSNVKRSLRYIQHLFQLNLLRDTVRGIVMTPDAQYIAKNIETIVEYREYQQRLKSQPTTTTTTTAAATPFAGMVEPITFLV